MLLHSLLLLLIGFGHFALIVVAVNYTHGVGFRAKALDVATVAALAIVGLATLATAWWARGHAVSEWPVPLLVYSAVCLIIALVVFPGITIARSLRPLPAGVTSRFNPTRTLATSDSSTSWMVRIPGNEALQLAIREVEITIPDLPSPLDGLTILHLTDLHMGPTYPRAYFEAVADEAARLGADLVLCSGDIVEHQKVIPWVVPILGRIPKGLGRFAILGNHDFHHHPGAIRSAVEAAGFEDVDGRWRVVEADGARIAIGGTSAPWGEPIDQKSAPAADLRIVLSHTPDRFPRLAAAGTIDLVLAGHNHGGQVRLPVVGPVLMPSVYSRRFDRGFFRIGRSLMFVGQGIGAKHPVRYNCPPELTRLRLVAAPAEVRQETRTGRAEPIPQTA